MWRTPLTTIDEIADWLYRIATFDQRVGISFNQYLILDERPTLVHTGSVQTFDGLLARVAEVVEPARLAYAFISHFEADECGALGRLRGVAKDLVPVCSAVTARQLRGFGLGEDALVQKEGDALSIGRRELRFVSYPAEMHLWEGLLAYAEPDRVLFSADLVIRPGPAPEPVVKAQAEEALRIAEAAIPSPEARAICESKLRALAPKVLALGHGPALDLRPA